LPEDALQRPGRDRMARLARDRHATWPIRMFELPVRALRFDSDPALGPEPPEYLADLHVPGLATSGELGQGRAWGRARQVRQPNASAQRAGPPGIAPMLPQSGAAGRVRCSAG